jgi:hypothetical protein
MTMKNMIIWLVATLLTLIGCAREGDFKAATPKYPDPIAAVEAQLAERHKNPLVIANNPAALVQFTRDVGRCNALLVAQGKTADEAIEICAKSTPPPGVRVPAAPSSDEGTESDVAPAPPPAVPQLIDSAALAPAYTGSLGNNKPSGCRDATCLFISGLPTVDHGRWMCSAISLKLDDRDVHWLNGAGRVVTYYVEPGDGFDTLGGNRISAMPEGRSGIVPLTTIDDGDSNRLPKGTKVGLHHAVLDCWDLTQRTVRIGGVMRVARFAIKIGSVTLQFANGSMGGPNLVPIRLPLADAWHR